MPKSSSTEARLCAGLGRIRDVKNPHALGVALPKPGPGRSHLLLRYSAAVLCSASFAWAAACALGTCLLA